MKIEGKTVTIFKIRNRKGYAAICCNNITEGRTSQEACARMGKGLKEKTEKIDIDKNRKDVILFANSK